ncbi:MAG: hypothetical protein PHU04_05265 [Candidatus Peribacteraceae bacterium]|nr:hypothetical protein [Candidatus Peribacteraceae bacterium]
MRIKSGENRMACPEQDVFFSEGCMPATFSGTTLLFEPGFYYERICEEPTLKNIANFKQENGSIEITHKLIPKHQILLPIILFFITSTIWWGWLLLAKKVFDESKTAPPYKEGKKNKR